VSDPIAVALLTGYGLTGIAIGWAMHHTADHARWRLEAWWHHSRATLAEARAETAEAQRRTAQDQARIARDVYLKHLKTCPLTERKDDAA
jgi:hypothetical protein